MDDLELRELFGDIAVLQHTNCKKESTVAETLKELDKDVPKPKTKKETQKEKLSRYAKTEPAPSTTSENKTPPKAQKKRESLKETWERFTKTSKKSKPEPPPVNDVEADDDDDGDVTISPLFVGTEDAKILNNHLQSTTKPVPPPPTTRSFHTGSGSILNTTPAY